jgi:hypothetical protein
MPSLSRLRRPALAALTIAAAAAAIAQLAPLTAAEAATSLKTVTLTGQSGPSPRVVSPVCPAGYLAVGAQVTMTGNTAGVHITGIWPTGRTMQVTTESFPGTAPRWAVTVKALCRPDGGDVTVVRSERKIANRNSDDDQRFGVATGAPCPAGKELVGMGGQAIGGFLSWFQPIGRGVPYSNDDSALMHGTNVVGKSINGSPANATIRALAICATPNQGSAWGHNEETEAKTPTKTVTADCPAGTFVHSFGFVIFYPNHYQDLTPFSFAAPTAMTIADTALTKVRLTATRHADNIPAESWGLIAEPLCAR